MEERRDTSINLQLKACVRLDNVHGLLGWGEDVAVIAMGLLLGRMALEFPLPWMVVLMAMAWVLIGTRQRGLATLLHESSHNLLAKNGTLNWLLGTLMSGWWILQIRSVYVRSHVRRHHPHLGDQDRDPDTIQYRRSGMLGQDPDTFILRNLFSMLIGAKAAVNLPYVLRDRLIPNREDVYSVRDWFEVAGFILFWILTLTIMAWAGLLGPFVLLWVLPYLTVFQAVNWLIEVAEHFPLTWLGKTGLDASRNRKGGPIERFFFGIHAEHLHKVHHLYVRIPYWMLDRAHRILMTDPAYARSESQYGGLFTRGRTGAPSILSRLPAELRMAARPYRNTGFGDAVAAGC